MPTQFYGEAESRGTRPFPWFRDLNFNPALPFASASLGVLMNTGSVAAPDPSAYRYLVSAANYVGNGLNAAGDDYPVVNPTDYGTGYYFYQRIGDKPDVTILRPYMVQYSSSGHTALAAAAATGAISGTVSIWTTRRCGIEGPVNTPFEYGAEFVGQVSLTNAQTRIASTTLKLPTGSQWCDAGTVVLDKSISPGIRFKSSGGTGVGVGAGANGALDILFDQQGGEGIIVQVSGLTASAGLGWLRTHL
jgi:hypothetical protein